MVQNLGSKAIYMGSDNTVTAANGLRISSNSTLELELGEDVSLWSISTNAGQDVRVFEVA